MVSDRVPAPSELTAIEPDDVVQTPFGYVARIGRSIHTRNTLNEVEHAELVAHLVSTKPELEQERSNLQVRLQELLRGTDPLELLMQFAVPYLAIDPDTFREWESDRSPAHVEYLALQAMRALPGVAAWEPRDMSERLEEAEDLVRRLFQLTTALYGIDFVESSSGTQEDAVVGELRFRTLLESLSIRGSSYPEHEILIVRGLFAPFDNELVSLMGFTADQALACADTLATVMLVPLEERFERSRVFVADALKAVKRSRRGKPSNDRMVASLSALPPKKARRVLQNLATAWTFAGSKTTFAIRTSDLATRTGLDESVVDSFLNALACSPNDAESPYFRYPAPTHPLRTRPLIRDGEGFLAPDASALLSGLRGRLEEAIQADANLFAKYDSHRGKWLERECERLLQVALPGCRTWRNLPWHYEDDSGEIDVLVEYDDLVVRVEAKAGGVTPPARRGAPLRMRDDLEKLIGEGRNQLDRLRVNLQRAGAVACGLGEQAEVFEKALQLEAVVTLEDLSAFAVDAYRLKELGTLPPGSEIPWILSLPDLMVVADVLKGLPFVHYMVRRSRLNRLGKVTAHDELDWLGHYIKEGLYFDELFQEDGGPGLLRLLSYSEQFDSWYFARAGVRTVETPKPEQVLPDIMAELISRLERERPPHHVTAGVLMLDLAGDDRDFLSAAISMARDRVSEKGWSNVSIGMTGLYGFTWYADEREPFPVTVMRCGRHANRKRRETNCPLWVVVADTPGTVAVQISTHDLRAALDAISLSPAVNLRLDRDQTSEIPDSSGQPVADAGR